MGDVELRPLPRGASDTRYRLSLGMVVMPDVRDDNAWNAIVENGIPHFDEWSSQGVVSNETRAFALSYKHTEHDFGKLSHEQANELRHVLTKLVGTGPNKSILWVDSMYMTREGMGLQDFSSRWVQYGLQPYCSLPVIKLAPQWDNVHPDSNKRSAWLWLEWTLGKRNKGVHSAEGFEKVSSAGLSVKDALKLWLHVDSEYGFRPSDEKDVRAEIDGKSLNVSATFLCPGRSSCIAYMLGKRNSPCGGTSHECVQLAKSTNGSYLLKQGLLKQGKLILSTVGRIAHCVLNVIEQSDEKGDVFLQRQDLSREELQEFNKVLIPGKLPFRNVRWLGLDRFQ